MRKNKTARDCIVIASVMLGVAFATPMITEVSAYAQEVSNDFSSGGSGGTSSYDDDGGLSDFLDNGSVDQEDLNVGNFIKNQRGVSGKNLQQASNFISPLTNFLGKVIGVIIALASIGIFVITAIDLLYIAIPPIRTFLYTPGTDGTGAATAGRGYGMGGPGMGMGMGMGMGGPVQEQRRKIQFVSDECVQVCSMMGGSSMTEGMGGMSRMGGYQAQPQNQMSRGSVMKTYLKKRAFFIGLFAVCLIILMSSALMGTGVNIAQWGLKLISAINNVTALK